MALVLKGFEFLGLKFQRCHRLMVFVGTEMTAQLRAFLDQDEDVFQQKTCHVFFRRHIRFTILVSHLPRLTFLSVPVLDNSVTNP